MIDADSGPAVMDSFYIANLTRKAQTHSAKDFKFAITEPTEPSSPNKKTHTPKPTTKGKNVKLGGKQKIYDEKFRKEWNEIKEKLAKLQKATTPDVKAFMDLQTQIYVKILDSGRQGNGELSAQTCSDCLSSVLLSTVQFFDSHSCPGTAHAELFKLLKVKPLKPSRNLINYQEQFNCLKEVDRGLDILPDPRCIGFKPTQLQRCILDSLDNNKSVVVRSGAGTGKTMLSMYLAMKMKKAGKKTVFIAPNKPLCTEASLFVCNQGLKLSVGNEEFFSWNEMLQADVMICTVRVFLRMLLFPCQPGMMDTIGAIVFDEFPWITHNRVAELSVVLMTAASRGWTIMSLSATLTDEMKDLLVSITDTDFLESKTSVRPKDLALYEFKDGCMKPISTSSTYTRRLLDQEDYLPCALRFPITYPEFKTLFDQSVKAPDGFNYRRALPRDKVVDAIDLTKFAIQQARATDRVMTEESSSCSRSTDSSSSEIPAPSPHEVWEVVQLLEKQNMLPVILFHTDRDKLDEYNEYITQKLEEHFKPRELTKAEQKRLKEIEKLKDEAEKAKARAELGSTSKPRVYGSMGITELAEIFPHRSKNGELVLKRRGTRVLNSPYYSGLKYGLGLHHHGISADVRNAVESGLRLQYLKVCLCDGTLALGLNMPVKTVAIICGGNSSQSPDDIVQSVGRAGRWGLDFQGQVVFIGQNERTLNKLWKPFTPLKSDFPMDPQMVLALCAATPEVRSLIPQWLQFKFNRPGTWSWENAGGEFDHRLKMLQELELITDELEVTEAGRVAISLMDEGPVALLAGLAFTSLLPDLREAIKTDRDFLYVVSHFITKWRVTKIKGPKITDAQELGYVISESTLEFTERLHEVARSLGFADTFEDHLVDPEEISAFYLSLPNFNLFLEAENSRSELTSYAVHFLQKMLLFQQYAKLPRGDEVLEIIDNFLN